MDKRFTFEEIWTHVIKEVEECSSRGLHITPLTIIGEDGAIEGWQLHGWEPPVGKTL